MTTLMNIGEAAKAADVSTKMIRNYEQIGLLPPAERSDAGYRLYGLRDVSALRFLRPSRRLGDAGVGQQADRLLHRSSRGQAHLQLQHFGDLVADGQQRVQRRHRLLKDHGNVVPPHSAQLTL